VRRDERAGGLEAINNNYTRSHVSEPTFVALSTIEFAGLDLVFYAAATEGQIDEVGAIYVLRKCHQRHTRSNQRKKVSILMGDSWAT
jgi:hypothetical protein